MYSIDFESLQRAYIDVCTQEGLSICARPGAQPGFYLEGGLVKFFVRKVCEKKLFNANFVHFSHNIRNLGGGLDPH